MTSPLVGSSFNSNKAWSVGQAVRVRDHCGSPWFSGVVVSLSPSGPVVQARTGSLGSSPDQPIAQEWPCVEVCHGEEDITRDALLFVAKDVDSFSQWLTSDERSEMLERVREVGWLEWLWPDRAAAASESAAAGSPGADDGVDSQMAEQIEKDLPRTWPHHPDAVDIQERTGQVLRDYCLCRNPAVGYCQGMNYVVALLTRVMATGEATLVFGHFVEQIVPDYYTGLAGVIADLDVLCWLLEEVDRPLADHLVTINFHARAALTQTLVCLFALTLPAETALLLWRSVITAADPRSHLLRLCVAVVLGAREQLLDAESSPGAHEVLVRHMEGLYGARALEEIVEAECSAIDDERIRQKRAEVSQLSDSHPQLCDSDDDADGRYALSGVEIGRRQWVQDAEATCCALCSRNFKLARRRHHCRHCGEVVCDSCSQHRVPLALDGQRNFRRVCDRCFEQGCGGAYRRPSPPGTGQKETPRDGPLQGVAVAVAALAAKRTAGVRWVEDDERSQCFVCDTPFSFTRRRHHCRMCGEVVCDACSRNREVIRDQSDPVRVCVRCKSTGGSDVKKRTAAGAALDLHRVDAAQRGPSDAAVESAASAQAARSATGSALSDELGETVADPRPRWSPTQAVAEERRASGVDSSAASERQPESSADMLPSPAGSQPASGLSESPPSRWTWPRPPAGASPGLAPTPNQLLDAPQPGRLRSPRVEVTPTATGVAVGVRRWVSDEDAASCKCCSRPFSLVRRRHHCRHCGEVVCAKCSKAREPLKQDGVVTAMRVCTDCADEFGNHRRHPLYELLGSLAPQCFYHLVSGCGGDVDRLLRLSAQELSRLLDGAGLTPEQAGTVVAKIRKVQLTGKYDLAAPPGTLQRSRDIPLS